MLCSEHPKPASLCLTREGGPRRSGDKIKSARMTSEQIGENMEAREMQEKKENCHSSAEFCFSGQIPPPS